MRQKKKRAQTLTEYLILICMVTVASIPIIGILTNVIRDQMTASAHRLAGESAHSQSKQIVEPAKNKIRRGLDDFWKQ